MQDYRRLRVHGSAHTLAIRVRGVTRQFPKAGYTPLKAQMTSAAESIAFNIVEGCGAESQKDFARFLDIAIKSAMELEYQLTSGERLRSPSRWGMGIAWRAHNRGSPDALRPAQEGHRLRSANPKTVNSRTVNSKPFISRGPIQPITGERAFQATTGRWRRLSRFQWSENQNAPPRPVPTRSIVSPTIRR